MVIWKLHVIPAAVRDQNWIWSPLHLFPQAPYIERINPAISFILKTLIGNLFNLIHTKWVDFRKKIYTEN